jgi:hypothetical protein
LQTGSAAPPPDKRKSTDQVVATQSLLDSIQAAKLVDELGLLAADRAHITYSELLAFIKSHDGADGDDEAHARADALLRAGVVLRLNGVVYLRPAEVAEMVYRVRCSRVLCDANSPTQPLSPHPSQPRSPKKPKPKTKRRCRPTPKRRARAWRTSRRS